MADSSTVAMPSTISPSAGMKSPASQTKRSPIFNSLLATCDLLAVDQFAGHGLGAHLAQGVGVGLAAALGHRLGEIGEEAGEPQPEANLDVEQVALVAAGTGMMVVQIEPSQTTNMTRFLISSRGFSFLNESITAWRNSSEYLNSTLVLIVIH